MNTRYFVWFGLVALGCGGGGAEPPAEDAFVADASDQGTRDEGALDAAPDAAPVEPSLWVDSPAFEVFVGSDAIIVRGRSDHPSGLVSVRVGEVEATSDDGYRTWRASVPLAWGPNRLEVLATADDGATSRVELRVLRRVPLGAVYASDFDAEQAWGMGSSSGGSDVLFHASLRTGVVTPLMRGDALDAFGAPLQDVAWHAPSQRLFVLTNTRLWALPVDPSLTAGTPEPFDDDRPDAPALISAATLALDGTRALVHDVNQSRLVAVELASGARRVLSDASSEGPNILDHRLRFVVDGERLVAAAFRRRAEPAIYAIDLTSGTRSLLASNAGSMFGDPTFLDEPGPISSPVDGRAYVFDQGDLLSLRLESGTLEAVDSGDSTLYAGADAGEFDGELFFFNPAFERLEAFAPDSRTLRTIAGPRFPRPWEASSFDDATRMGDALVLALPGQLVALSASGVEVLRSDANARWHVAHAGADALVVYEERDEDTELFIMDRTGAFRSLARFDGSDALYIDSLVAQPGVAAYAARENELWRFDLMSGARESVDTSGLPPGRDLAIAYGTALYAVADATVYERVEGVFRTYATFEDEGPLVRLRGLAFDGQGLLVVAGDAEGSALYRVRAEGREELIQFERGVEGLRSAGDEVLVRGSDGAHLSLFDGEQLLGVVEFQRTI